MLGEHRVGNCAIKCRIMNEFRPQPATGHTAKSVNLPCSKSWHIQEAACRLGISSMILSKGSERCSNHSDIQRTMQNALLLTAVKYDDDMRHLWLIYSKEYSEVIMGCQACVDAVKTGMAETIGDNADTFAEQTAWRAFCTDSTGRCQKQAGD